MASWGGSTGKKSFIDPSILTKNVVVDEEEQTVSGDGLFDVLMDTATKHLRAQFDANRIREEDYATAYVDIYKATLQAALQAWDTSLKDDEKDAQIALLEAQRELVLAQVETEKKKPAQLDAQTALTNEQAETQACQTDLVCAQHREEEYKISDILPAQKAQVEAQTAKLIEDKNLTVKQELSEERKAALYLRQAESFNEDYKQKILKILLDSWTTGYSIAQDAATISSVPSIIGGGVITDFYNNFVASDLDFGSKFNPSTGTTTTVAT